MKIGDHVKMSAKNSNPQGTDVCAYAGMEGIVTKVFKDNAFSLNCGTCSLIVPMENAFHETIKGIWIELNGVEIFHRPIAVKYVSSIPTLPFNALKPKNWFQKLFNI